MPGGSGGRSRQQGSDPEEDCFEVTSRARLGRIGPEPRRLAFTNVGEKGQSPRLVRELGAKLGRTPNGSGPAATVFDRRGSVWSPLPQTPKSGRRWWWDDSEPRTQASS